MTDLRMLPRSLVAAYRAASTSTSYRNFGVLRDWTRDLLSAAFVIERFIDVRHLMAGDATIGEA